MFDLGRIRVCFLAGTLAQGGAERQLFYMLQALRERDVKVRLLSLTSGEFWEEKLQKLGVPVEWVGKSPSRIVRLREVIRSLRREPANVVQSQHFYTNAYATAAGWLTGTQSIAAIRSDMVSEIRAKDAVVRRYGLQWSGAIACNSRPALEKAAEFGIAKRKLRFLPNVVDTAYFIPPAAGYEGPFTVAAVGRLVQSKRHDRLITAFAKLKAFYEGPARLILAGDGDCREALERQASEAGLSADTQFLGNQSDLRAVYQSASVLAITSDYEGTPNVALEAMACGVPVVATRVGGLADIVHHGINGFLAEREDVDGFTGHLLRLARDESTRNAFAIRARRFVVDNHATSRMPQFLTELYASVV